MRWFWRVATAVACGNVLGFLYVIGIEELGARVLVLELAGDRLAPFVGFPVFFTPPMLVALVTYGLLPGRPGHESDGGQAKGPVSLATGSPA